MHKQFNTALYQLSLNDRTGGAWGIDTSGWIPVCRAIRDTCVTSQTLHSESMFHLFSSQFNKSHVLYNSCLYNFAECICELNQLLFFFNTRQVFMTCAARCCVIFTHKGTGLVYSGICLFSLKLFKNVFSVNFM